MRDSKDIKTLCKPNNDVLEDCKRREDDNMRDSKDIETLCKPNNDVLENCKLISNIVNPNGLRMTDYEWSKAYFDDEYMLVHGLYLPQIFLYKNTYDAMIEVLKGRDIRDMDLMTKSPSQIRHDFHYGSH